MCGAGASVVVGGGGGRRGVPYFLKDESVEHILNFRLIY